MGYPYRVSTSQIDSDAARTRRKYEHKDPRVDVESVHERLTLLNLGRTIETDVAVAVKVEERLEYVKYSCHLGEY